MATEVGSLQASLSLDISNFAQGMQQAVALVQQLGQQLSAALGNTQGFSALQRQATDLKAEIESIVAAVKSLRAELNNSQNASQIFASIKQHTSGLSGEFNKIHTSLQQIIDLLQQIGTTANTTASSTSQMASNMAAFTSAAQNAARNTRQTTSNSRQASNAIRQANNQASKLSNNLRQGAGFAVNLKHIMEGIIISQSFYRLLNIMNELVEGSAQFMNNMAQTEIAFKYLLGSEEKASTMLESLQDLSINAPISTSDATQMSRKLMAMGFSAKSVIPTLQILTDTAAVFTNEAGQMNDMMQHVVIALGQMKSAGKVSMQELRQLYNAGIPIFQILQDGLGLTAQEVRNIGKLGIDSGAAILAILNELQKKYSGAAAEMTRTIPGALEVIKDSIFVINNILFSAPFDWITKQLNVVADWMGAIVKIARVYGPGGIFQAMFPREWQMALRNVIGTFQELGKALSYIGKTVGLVFKETAGIIINIVGTVGPPIAILIHTLSQVAYWIMVNIPLVRYLFAALLAYVSLTIVAKVLLMIAKATKLLTVAQLAAKCVMNLIGALKNLWAFSKVGFILMMVAGAFLAVALASEKARAAIMAFFGKIQGAAKDFSDKLDIGFDPNDIAQPEFTPPAENDWGDMAGGLGDIADGYDDVADAADNATKAQKKNQSFLQSFDEVYQIKPKDDSGSGDDDGPLGGMKDTIDDLMSSLEDLDATMNGMDWSGDFWADWGNISADLGGFDSDALDIGKMGADFWKALVDAFSAPEWVGAALSAIIGGLLGSLIGHPIIGAAIGALAGWVAGLYWDNFKEAFNLSDYAPITAAVAGAIAFALGKMLKWGPLKIAVGTLGAALGSMVMSTILSKIAEACSLGEYTSDSIAIGQGVGTLIGAAIGLAVGHPIIGAAAGNLAGGVVGLIWGALKEKLGVTNWQGIADIIGSGMGAAFTGLAAGFWSVTIEPLTSSLAGAVTQGLTFSLKNGIRGGILGAIAGLTGGLLTNALTGWIAKELNMGEGDLKNSAIGQSVGGLIGSIVGLIVSGGNPIGVAIGNMVGQVIGGIAGLFTNQFLSWITNALKTVREAIYNWACNAFGEDVVQAFIAPWKNLWGSLSSLFEEIFTNIKQAWANKDWGELGFNIIQGILVSILSSLSAIPTFIATLFQSFWDAICTAFGIHSPATTMMPIGQYIILGIIEGMSASISSIITFLEGLANTIIETLGNAFTSLGPTIATWASSTAADISIWVSNTKTKFFSWTSGVIADIRNWATNTANSINTWYTNTSTKFNSWISGTAAKFSNWVSNTSNKISTWVSNTSSRITTWYSTTTTKISSWASAAASKISSAVSNMRSTISSGFSGAATAISSWASRALSSVSNFCSGLVNKISSAVKNAIGWLNSLFSAQNRASSASIPSNRSISKSVSNVTPMKVASIRTMSVANEIPTTTVLARSTPMSGISGANVVGDGGVSGLVGTSRTITGAPAEDNATSFFSGNNATAFATKIGKEIVSNIAPFFAGRNSGNDSEDKRPIYVGTLIADDRGLKELERKLKVIRVKEEKSGR